MEKHAGMGEESKPIPSLHGHPDKGTIYAVGETINVCFENTFSSLLPGSQGCHPRAEVLKRLTNSTNG